MEKFNEKALGLSLAGIAGGLYFICSAAYLLIPNAVNGIGQSMFHGLALNNQTITIPGVLTGLIAWIVVAFVTGYSFGLIYNKSVKTG